MKKQFLLVVLGCAAVLPFGTTASAQSGPKPSMVAQVNFDFTVGGSQMPAGKYEVTAAEDTLVFRNLDGKGMAMVRTMHAAGATEQRNALRFERRNGQLSLEEVKWSGSNDHLQIAK